MINSVYGTTMENLRKRAIVRLVSNEKEYLKYFSKSTHISRKIFDKNCAAIHEIKPGITYQTNLGWFTVLELSKWLMYEFHYHYIKKTFLMLNCSLLAQTVLPMK